MEFIQGIFGIIFVSPIIFFLYSYFKEPESESTPGEKKWMSLWLAPYVLLLFMYIFF